MCSNLLKEYRDKNIAGKYDNDEFPPFSNGSEYMIWEEHNCQRCKMSVKGIDEPSECELEEALLEATITGTIPIPIIERIGYTFKPYFMLTECKEMVWSK